MMAERRNPSFWMPPLIPSQAVVLNSSASSLSSPPVDFPKPSKAILIPNCHDPPETWSQPLLYQALSALRIGGYEKGDEGGGHNTSANNQYTFHGKDQAEAQAAAAASRSHSWSNNNTTTTQVAVPGSSPTSCQTTTSFSSSSSANNNNSNKNNSTLDFFSKYKKCTQQRNKKHHHESNHYSSDQCSSGAALKKARIQASPAESSLKVRKEKLGDRVAALHQLVSPFGKTDTASILLEAIGYIRFLQAQVEALSSPYLGGGSRKDARQCGGDEDRDLRSRGLCLVPVSFSTLHVGGDNGAHFWTPNFGMGI